ncbi:MAG: FumA C-terminus/TtdB family hydratase beta subunit [Candidatus Omnitrophica bacterium]|nr:FumA C-terminus/TtdB family hydratase beta subunit [Candidatus Omnitrophota bacterium]
MKIINTPLCAAEIGSLKAGEEVFLNGIIYTARDQAHKRIVNSLGKGRGKGREIPFNLKGAVVYYCGPTQTPKGRIIGSCGPTTSSRMDAFTVPLLRKGLKGMIGKGSRSPEVRAAIKKYRAVYFVTYAGCGALLSRHVKSARKIAYHDLGPEAVMELKVENFPLVVAIDSLGNDIYERG